MSDREEIIPAEAGGETPERHQAGAMHASEHPGPRSADTAETPAVTPDEPVTTVSRRRFLEGVGAVAGIIAAGVVPAVLSSATGAAAEEAQPSSAETGGGIAEIVAEDNAINYPGKPVWYAKDWPAGKQKWAMVIDVKACIGCRKCVYACVKENNIGRKSGFTYIQVLEMNEGEIDLETAKLDYGDGGKPDKWYLPVQCMHCAKPTCVYGCPVKATWKEPDGIVVIDYDKCIACRNCIVTCPYGARHFNWVEPDVPEAERNPKVPVEERAGVVDKCTWCIQRTRNGATTACVEACPVGARKFGDLNDPDSDVSILLKTRRVIRLKEEEGTEPMIWYVG